MQLINVTKSVCISKDWRKYLFSLFSATNWCHCLIKHCQQNKSFWETEGRKRFKEHFEQLVLLLYSTSKYSIFNFF